MKQTILRSSENSEDSSLIAGPKQGELPFQIQKVFDIELDEKLTSFLCDIIAMQVKALSTVLSAKIFYKSITQGRYF